jgi:multidrug efflux pump subunit AcrB
MQTLQLQNVVQESGKIKVDERYLRITPSGSFDNEKQIADTLIGHSGSLVKLGDVANIYRDYLEPRRTIMRFNGKPAIGLGVSCVTGGNVITMGTAINQKLDELQSKKPVGISLDSLYYQSNIVTEAVNIFVVNLIEAVIIVIVLLMLFMGWRSGLLIGVILLLTILATFIGMLILGIDLQKISLGALILALGMLVDNAIVVTDGILVRTQSGEDRKTAALKTVDETSWPLFGATIIAILAFTAISFSPGNVGEFCRSLFDVMALSLSFSWILAVTITPLLCTYILPSKQKEHEKRLVSLSFFERNTLCKGDNRE